MSDKPEEPRQVIELSGTAKRSPFGPTRCMRPNLSGIDHNTTLVYILNSTFRGAGAHDPKASAYLRGFILVTDKAIFEYQAARAAFQQFVETRNRTSLYIRSTAHLETCIHTTRRALRYVDRLRGTIGNVLPRDDWRAIQTYSESVREVRDIIEHMDDEIAADRISEDGYVIALVLSDEGDAAVIGTLSITFDRLALLLHLLYALATLLADYREQEEQNATTAS